MMVGREPFPTFGTTEYRPGIQPSAVAPLSEQELRVWYRSLACSPSEFGRLHSLLSSDEIERAARFRFDADRNHFIVARGTLRMLLGAYWATAPSELSFTYSQYGKPSLVNQDGARTIEFNLSHSGGLALFAFAVGRRIGIDVETLRRDLTTSEIAERFFSTVERAALRQLPEGQRHHAFFLCWTRKEAFIKALGEGLSHPLDQFDVSLDPAGPASLLATRPDALEAHRWVLWNVPLPGDYVAALAAEVHRATD